MPMKVTILGTSSALPTSERSPSAHVLNVHERLYLIDCGEGTQMQMRRYRLRFAKINHVFISHLHGDHVFGLYGLLSTFNLMGRTTPLNLFAPASFDEILKRHLGDFDIRLGFEILFHPLKKSSPEIILSDKRIIVTAFPLKHRVTSFGFLFREKEQDRKILKEAIEKYRVSTPRIPAIKKGADLVLDNGTVINNEELTIPGPEPLSYAYCSDTKYFSKLASYVKNTDLLYHEATFAGDLKDFANTTGHSTGADAALTARNANAGKLLIGHFSARYRDVSPILSEAREVFPDTEAAIDGNTYEVTHFKESK